MRDIQQVVAMGGMISIALVAVIAAVILLQQGYTDTGVFTAFISLAGTVVGVLGGAISPLGRS